jgi:2-polyprenyl-3-methyl-5-hydroxy-6-metoxy-1,4-benzoquinol methylase
MSRAEKIEKLTKILHEALDCLKEIVLEEIALEAPKQEIIKQEVPKQEIIKQEIIKQEASKQEIVKQDDFEQIKALLESKDWPNAVPPELICDQTSDNDKKERAEGIIELVIDEPLDGKKFLDFGCGEGHIVKKALERNAVKSVGYDIINSSQFMWEKEENNCLLTINWDNVSKNGPYDIILLYDVLDHISGKEQALDIMNKIKSVKTKDAKVYIRCHPFCSRHGGHLYTKINKAFMHLIFSEKELELMNCPLVGDFWKLPHPEMAMRELFVETGFEKIKEEIISEMAEDFFMKNKLIRPRLQKFWKDSYQEKLRNGQIFPGFQTAESFIDFVLK